MIEFAIENVTKRKCLECGEKLTAWENEKCILCEVDTELELEGDEYE
jgi:hypothetical protein